MVEFKPQEGMTLNLDVDLRWGAGQELVQQNGWYRPHEWNWFSLNKKDKHEHKDKRKDQNKIADPRVFGAAKFTFLERARYTPLIQTDLPGNCYMGACEMLVGALVWLIPFPGTGVLASIMIVDPRVFGAAKFAFLEQARYNSDYYRICFNSLSNSAK